MIFPACVNCIFMTVKSVRVIDGGHGSTIDTVSSRWVQGGAVIDVFALGLILPALLSDCQTGSGSASHCNMDPSVLRFNRCDHAYQHKQYCLCQRWWQRQQEKQLPQSKRVSVCVKTEHNELCWCFSEWTSYCNTCMKRKGKWDELKTNSDSYFIWA